MSADLPTLPVTGLLRCGLHGKVTHLFVLGKQIFLLIGQIFIFMGDQLLILEAVCFFDDFAVYKTSGRRDPEGVPPPRYGWLSARLIISRRWRVFL